MKSCIAMCAMMIAVLAFTNDAYDPIYDNVDVKGIINNPRLLRHYGQCFLGKGPCSPEGLDFKKAIPEALESETVCRKCTPKQRQLVRMMVDAFKTKEPEIWKELVEKLDPEGMYSESFAKFLRETD